MTLVAEMPKKPVASESGDRTTLKVDKEMVRKLSVIAAHRGKSASALADLILAAYVEEEYPKIGDEIKKGN